MSDYICHDFKTPRNDTSKRLPDAFKAVPVLFYLSLIASGAIMTMDYLQYKQAVQEKKTQETVKADHDAATQEYEKERASLTAEAAKAELLAKWTEGSRNIQPVGVAIARSMPPEVRLSDLSLERSMQVPANLSLSVRINGGSATEVGLMETSLARLQYRAYSPQSNKEGDVVEYRSTLVRQEQ
jgi:hypothetical protein